MSSRFGARLSLRVCIPMISVLLGASSGVAQQPAGFKSAGPVRSAPAREGGVAGSGGSMVQVEVVRGGKTLLEWVPAAFFFERRNFKLPDYQGEFDIGSFPGL